MTIMYLSLSQGNPFCVPYMKHEEAIVPRPLNGCGKLQICNLSGKKLENSLRSRQVCLISCENNRRER